MHYHEILLSRKDADALWTEGYYGSKDGLPRLSPFEAFYLLGQGKLLVQGFRDFDILHNEFEGGPMFPLQYKAYAALRNAGWIVRSGLNYGTDFVLYRSSPDVEHAEFAVLVMSKRDQTTTWRGLLGVNRSCVGAKKKLLVAAVDPDSDEIRILEVERWQPEAERMLPAPKLPKH